MKLINYSSTGVLHAFDGSLIVWVICREDFSVKLWSWVALRHSFIKPDLSASGLVTWIEQFFHQKHGNNTAFIVHMFHHFGVMHFWYSQKKWFLRLNNPGISYLFRWYLMRSSYIMSTMLWLLIHSIFFHPLEGGHWKKTCDQFWTVILPRTIVHEQ